MKKIIYVISVAFIFLACTKKENELPVNNSEFQESVEDITEFSAVFGEVPVVKSELSGSSVLWNEGDEISIIWNGGKTTAQADAAGAQANFLATVERASEYFAVYPASSEVSLNEGVLTVGIPAEQHGKFEDVNIAIARTSDHKLVFKNLCALGNFTLERNDIAKVEIKSNGTHNLAGNVTLSLNTDGIPSVSSVDSSSGSIILTPASGESFAAGTYYFATVPVTLEDGVSFTLTTLSGNTIIGKASRNSAPLVRSEILDFSKLDDIANADAIRVRFLFGPEAGAKAIYDPEGNWPDNYDSELINGKSYIYPIDGNDYSFFVKDLTDEGKFKWNTNDSNGYADRIGVPSSTVFFGLPSIEGLSLTNVVVGQSRRGAKDNSASLITTVGITDRVPEGTEQKSYVAGGELQRWTGWTGGRDKTVVDHMFNLSGTAANTVYYLNSDNPNIGLYFSSLIITYEKPDCAFKEFREDWQGDGQSAFTIAYDKLEGNASEFIKAFEEYTGYAPQSYLENSEHNAKEILVGKTSRKETEKALKDIIHGFKIAIYGDKLVIAGTDDNWTAVAMYEFENKILKSPEYLDDGCLKIPNDLNLSESYDDPQMIARLLNRGYTQFTLTTEKVMSCAGEGDVKIAQGAASDGTYVYFVLRNSGDSQARVFKYDMTGRQVAKSAVFNGGHCNDMTLNTRTSTLYVAHGSAAPKVLTPLAGSNLSIGTDISISVGTGAITYNATRNSYAISQGGKNLILCDADFNKVQGYTRTDDNEYTPQGMGSDDHYVYFPMSSSKDNILVVYDWNGKHVATLKVDLALESESMFYAGGNYYVNFHEKSKGAQLYKVTPVLKYSHN